MRLPLRAALLALAVLLPSAASAELQVGASAPAFSARGARGGTDLDIVLADWLRKGPVVIYFYPKSFTATCTEEAHLFAEASAEFEALGAAVVGVSGDTIETQREFSKLECRDKFPVAADPDGTIIRAYDVTSPRSGPGSIYARRTSYVIAPDGRIAATHTASDAESHIQSALAAVKALRSR